MEWYRDSTEGRRPSSQRANQIAQELGYDDAHQLKGENGNVTTKNNTLDSAYSQTYTYDQLNRLASSTLGGAAYQSWTLDSQGNWNSYTSNGTAQTETANAQNQITSINGTSAAPTYDANGNMTTAEYGENTLVYDAWNRLVSVTSVAFGGQAIAKYTYNALGYRITATYPAGTGGAEIEQQYYLYYDAMGQMIETRAGGTANNNVGSQMVWSAAYVNAAVLQDAYVNGVLQPDSRTYFQQDANWNMTAFVGLSGGAWQVMDRVVYSPYGGFVVYNSTWSGALSNSLPPTMDVSLYQGMAIDPMTGLYYARNRNYDPTLGRWINQDPAGFINGGNTYQFVMSNPVGNVDPWGLAVGHHIVPKQIYKLLFDPNSPGYGFFENFYTGKTSPNHGNSAAHQRYTDAVRKLVKKWLKGHPDVNPECPDFSEDNAKAIADDVLKSDDPGIRDFLQNVLNKVVDPSKYFQQMANTFEDAGGNLIATAKPESAPVENILQNIATNASNNAPRDETLAQQAESLLQEAENIIEADATALEQGIEEAP